ncbi:MAG: DUF1499 domain-containing protein [Hydrogenophaga sp.]
MTTMTPPTFPLFPATAAAVLGLALLLSGCASTSLSSAPAGAARVSDSYSSLSCALPSNCVNSLDGGLSPLRFEGTPAQAIAALRAALAEFPEATVGKADGMSIEAVFTTAVGFRDTVDFNIDAPARRIHFRSRSSFGLYDFGKNRSRMVAFASRFEQTAQR